MNHVLFRVHPEFTRGVSTGTLLVEMNSKIRRVGLHSLALSFSCSLGVFVLLRVQKQKMTCRVAAGAERCSTTLLQLQLRRPF